MLKVAQARPTDPVREGTGLPRTRDHQHQRTGVPGGPALRRHVGPGLRAPGPALGSPARWRLSLVGSWG